MTAHTNNPRPDTLRRMLRRKPFEERFWPKVDKTSECWLWTGHVSSVGYGQFRLESRDTRVFYAHRLSYLLLVGPIPAGMELDHLCRVRHCVNPAHLDVVTHTENMRRTRRSHCKWGHSLADAYVNPRDGQRHCRECNRIRHRKVVA